MKKILIVDDDAFLIHAYVAKLSRAGYELKVAQDGAEAMQIMLKDKFIPDLVLLDLVMPKMNGFDVLEAMHRHNVLDKVLVLVTSNLGQDEDIAKAKELGAADFIVKSELKLKELVIKIESLMECRYLI